MKATYIRVILLLGNGAVNTFPQTNQHATKERLLKDMFSVWSASEAYVTLNGQNMPRK
jgi:hypothetical protein